MEPYPLTREAFDRRFTGAIGDDPALRITIQEWMEKKKTQNKEKVKKKQVKKRGKNTRS